MDTVVDSGLELMKHISNEEAMQLKDKLDGIQRKYGELTSKAAEMLKAAQKALPLVQLFHERHENLTEWLIDVESQISSLDSAGLNLQEQEIQVCFFFFLRN